MNLLVLLKLLPLLLLLLMVVVVKLLWLVPVLVRYIGRSASERVA